MRQCPTCPSTQSVRVCWIRHVMHAQHSVIVPTWGQTLSTARHVPASPMIDEATCQTAYAGGPASTAAALCMPRSRRKMPYSTGATCWAHVHTLMFEMQTVGGYSCISGCRAPLGVGVQGLDLVGGRGVHKGDLGVDLHQRCADGVHKHLQPDACEPLIICHTSK